MWRRWASTVLSVIYYAMISTDASLIKMAQNWWKKRWFAQKHQTSRKVKFNQFNNQNYLWQVCFSQNEVELCNSLDNYSIKENLEACILLNFNAHTVSRKKRWSSVSTLSSVQVQFLFSSSCYFLFMVCVHQGGYMCIYCTAWFVFETYTLKKS